MGIPQHLTCLLRNLFAGQEATVRTGHKTDWFQIGKRVCQGCILSPCLFNWYAEYIMRHWARWSTSWNQECQEKYQEPQICRWHHPYGRKQRTKESLDECEKMRVIKVGLKLSIQKTKIMASGSITSWQIYGESVEIVTLYFFELQNNCRSLLQPCN